MPKSMPSSRILEWKSTGFDVGNSCQSIRVSRPPFKNWIHTCDTFILPFFLDPFAPFCNETPPVPRPDSHPILILWSPLFVWVLWGNLDAVNMGVVVYWGFRAFWVSDRGSYSCILIPLGSAVRVSCLLGAFWGPAVGAFLLAAAGFLPVAVRGVLVLGASFGLAPLFP